MIVKLRNDALINSNRREEAVWVSDSVTGWLKEEMLMNEIMEIEFERDNKQKQTCTFLRGCMS